MINVSSGGMYTQGLHLDDLQSTEGRFRGAVAYSRSKRIEVVLTELWAQRLQGTGVVVNSMHPGWVDTPGLRESLPRIPQADAPAAANGATGRRHDRVAGGGGAGGEVSGGFWLDHARRPKHCCRGAASQTPIANGCGNEVERFAGV